MKKKYLIILISCIIVIGVGITLLLTNKKEETTIEIPSKEVKTKEQEIDLKILRYEEDVFNIDKNNVEKELLRLSKIYPFFIPAEQIQNPEAVRAFVGYLNDPIIQEIYKEVKTTFPDLDLFKQQFTQAYSRYLVLFPNDSVPTVITSVPGIQIQAPSVFQVDNHLHIHLDLYLGADNNLYKQCGFPLYISERMDKKFLLVDCFKKAIVYKHLPEKTLITLLDNIIYEGKKLYFTQVMLPDEPVENIIGYNAEKFQWAEQNYGKVWAYIVENNLLYSKEENVLRQYIEEAPFTNPFGNQSPGRFGQFLGWKIISAYMKNNPDITLEDLLKNADSHAILNNSKFKPTK